MTQDQKTDPTIIFHALENALVRINTLESRLSHLESKIGSQPSQERIEAIYSAALNPTPTPQEEGLIATINISDTLVLLSLNLERLAKGLEEHESGSEEVKPSRIIRLNGN